MRIFLFRHPPYAIETSGLCLGCTDVPAEIISADELGRFIVPLSAVTQLYSSDLLRSREMGCAFSAFLRVPLEIDSRLRELHYGDWEKRTWKSIESSDSKNFLAWMRDPVNEGPPAGESFLTLSKRVQAWRSDTCERHSQGTIAVITHAGVIRALLCDALGLPLENAQRLRIDHCSLCEITYYPDRPPTVGMVNSLL